jgi:hypothetical protein
MAAAIKCNWYGYQDTQEFLAKKKQTFWQEREQLLLFKDQNLP